MARRITAALLSLMLLLMMPVIPAGAEEGTGDPVYKEGDKVWVSGYGNKPEATLEEWFYWQMTGESRQGECPYVQHVHTRACRDENWNRICGFDYEHEHDPFCIIDAVEYEWVVVLDVEKLPPSENPIITIHSKGPEGEPLAGCGYILLHERIKTDSSGNPLVDDNGKYVLESIVLGRTTTDDAGVALLGLEELNLDTDEKTVTLLLGQELSNSLQDQYRPLLNRWYVTIERGTYGGCAIRSITRAPAVTVAPDAPAPEATTPGETLPSINNNPGELPEEELFVEEYDKQTGILTVVNEYLRGSLKIDVQFEGFTGPVPAEVMATVVIPELADTDKGTLEFTVNENGFYLIQASVDELQMGTYTVTASDPVQIDGYDAEKPVIQVRSPIDADPVDASSVTLDRYHQNARFIITYRYTAQEQSTDPTEDSTPTGPNENTNPTGPTEDTDPTEKPSTPPESDDLVTPNMSNTVVVRVIDELEQPLPGTEIALYNGKDQLQKWRETYENIFVLDELEKFAKTGESVTLTLRQTRAPAGYRLSGDSYTVKISNKNGVTEVDVKKNTGAMQNLFKGNGIEVGSDGKQVVTFRNARKTAQMQLTCHVDVGFGEGSWVDEALVTRYKLQQYEFTLNWEDSEGNAQTETVLLADGESILLDAELPYGTDYEVTVAAADGSFRTEYSQTHTGTVDTTHLKENILVEATQCYTVAPGNGVSVDLVKVDSETKLPLPGVRFVLNNEKGDELAAYISGENGELTIRNVLTEPGVYALEETETLEGYVLLEEPVLIHVTTEYALDTTTGIPVMVQNLVSEIAHSSVVAESDGSFWIENVPAEQTEEPEESEGSGMGLIIGAGVAVAVAAAATAAVLLRRKRRAG